MVCFAACAKTSYRTTRTQQGKQGMVVSAHPLASEVGLDILRAGGNATDATIAVQFALAVVCPRAGNLGGGGFWVNAPAGDKVRTIDYRERAPSAATRDMYLDANGEVIPDLSTLGPLAAGIPGTVDGMWAAYTYGSQLKDWKMLVEPAAMLARRGFTLSQTEADRLNSYAANFELFGDDSNPFRQRIAIDGSRIPWKVGDLFIQIRLANTLDSIATVGAKYFYDGRFAERLSAEVDSMGGVWSVTDLNDYQSTWREAIEIDYQGYKIYSMPPPSSGGVVLAQMLSLLAPYNLDSIYKSNQLAYHHLLTEAMRRAYEDRAIYLGDPDFVNVPVDSLLDQTYLASKWRDFHWRSASESTTSLRAAGRDVYETTHTSVIDASGNATSVTTTLNGNYGSKVWSKVGGFFLNNEMDDFSAKPGAPNMFGLVGGEANAIATGKRMLSSMTPTIVRKDEEVVLSLGSPGGSTIITAVMQVMLNNLVLNMPLDKAIKMGRIHHQWLPDEVVYERGKIDPKIIEGLRDMGHNVRGAESIGRVKAVAKTGDKLIGVGDGRNKDDTARGF